MYSTGRLQPRSTSISILLKDSIFLEKPEYISISPVALFITLIGRTTLGLVGQISAGQLCQYVKKVSILNIKWILLANMKP